jgi:hypothetical protein
MKSFEEVQSTYNRTSTQVALAYLDQLQEIREARELVHLVNYDLSQEEHHRLLTEEKKRRFAETYEAAKQEYRTVVEEYADEVYLIRPKLRKELFKVDDRRGATDVAMATEEQLERTLDFAVHVSNETLAKQVFAAADLRGYGRVVNRYLNEVEPGAREAYDGMKALPSEEDIRRHFDNVEQMIKAPDFDRVHAPARVT